MSVCTARCVCARRPHRHERDPAHAAGRCGPMVSQSDRSISVLSHRHRATSLSDLLSARTSGPDVWTRVLERLQTKLPTWDFRKWFGSTKQWKISTDGLTLFVAVDGPLHQRWIHDHYRQQVAAAVAEAAIPRTSSSLPQPPRPGGPPPNRPRWLNQPLRGHIAPRHDGLE